MYNEKSQRKENLDKKVNNGMCSVFQISMKFRVLDTASKRKGTGRNPYYRFNMLVG